MLKSLGQIIQAKGQKSRHYHSKKVRGNVFDFLHLVDAWSEVVGDYLSEHTIPQKMRGRYLVVLTRHPAYAQQLDYMSEELKKKVLEKFPALFSKLDRIVFECRPGPFEQLEKKRELNLRKSSKEKKAKKWSESSLRFNPDYLTKRKMALEELAHVEDPELKELLVSLKLQLETSDS